MSTSKDEDIIKAEKRRQPRIDNIFIDYSLEKENSQKISTFAKNISACGICILLLENIEIGTTVFLTIYLPDGEGPIHTKGETIWTKPSPFLIKNGKNHFEAGINYNGIADTDQARILQTVVRSCNLPIEA